MRKKVKPAEVLTEDYGPVYSQGEGLVFVPKGTPIFEGKPLSTKLIIRQAMELLSRATKGRQ